MKSASSNRIYLWSKRFGAILLIAMAVVAVGNAQQFSAGEKGKIKGQILPERATRLSCRTPKQDR
jgi:hypothetical protein